MNLIEYADRELLAISVANVLASELRKSLTMHDFVSLAVPGGTTPAPIFDLLSAADLEWGKVHVMLTDERWVDEANDASNARLVKNHLLTDRAVDAHFLPFYRDGLSAEAGSAEVASSLQGELPISVLLLGMGADMHTASLFPASPGLAEAMAPGAPLLCPARPPSQDTARVTLAAHVLKGAMSKHLVIFGDEKRSALEKAMTLPPQDAPIGAVIGGGTVHWAP
ncbi:MAG: 6-phosphogluconolactonase [Sulfitobacter sp.]